MKLTLEAIRRPLRRIKKQLLHTAEPAPAPSIIECYSKNQPTDQEAINIFSGEWSSQLPQGLSLQAGTVKLFDDERIRLGLAALGGVAGQKVLELGPLEGGHSYQLEKAGAASVLAVEANSRAYLKCLIAKEITGMNNVHFKHGDFMSYLRAQPPRFDMVLASGVLYHQQQPMELISLLSGITDRVLVWTHYYDEEIVRESAHLMSIFKSVNRTQYSGYEHTLHRQEYQTALLTPGFCGAGAHYSHWMERDELLGAWKHVGYRMVEVLQEDRYFVNGPCFLLAVQR